MRRVPRPSSRWELGSVVHHSPATTPTGSLGRVVSSGHAWGRRVTVANLDSEVRPDLVILGDFAAALTSCAFGTFGSSFRVAVLFLDRKSLPTVARAARSRAVCARSPHKPPAGACRRLCNTNPDETRTATEGGTLPRAADITWVRFSGVRCQVSPMQTQTPRFAYKRARCAASIRYAVGVRSTPLCQVGLHSAGRSTFYLRFSSPSSSAPYLNGAGRFERDVLSQGDWARCRERTSVHTF